MNFVPKHMQFKPMNNMYEDGMNPWSVHRYDEDKKVLIRCGSKEEYDKVEQHDIIPDQIKDYISKLPTGIRVFLNMYPGSLNTMLTINHESGTEKFEIGYMID